MSTATMTHRATLAELAASVVAELGGTWQIEAGSYGWRYFAADDAGQRIAIDNADRTTVVTRLGILDATPSKRHTVIRCSVSRGVEAIAADIGRRLLPGMLGALSEHDAAELAQAEDEARRDALAERLTGMVPGARLIEHSPGRASWFHNCGDTWRDTSGGQIDVNRDGTRAKIQVDGLRPDEAERVAHLIATIAAERGIVAVSA